MSHKSDSPLPDNWQQLVEASRTARTNAYAPFSNYAVGAALLTDEGRIFAGCNVENSSYGLTICAERVAACSAVAAGCREFSAIVISLTGIAIPCGTCRQFLYEFNPDMTVVIDDLEEDDRETPETVSLRDLLPRGFRLETERA